MRLNFLSPSVAERVPAGKSTYEVLYLGAHAQGAGEVSDLVFLPLRHAQLGGGQPFRVRVVVTNIGGSNVHEIVARLRP